MLPCQGRRFRILARWLASLLLLVGSAEFPGASAAAQDVEAPRVGQPVPPIVRKIEVKGLERYEEADLVAALGQTIGRPLDLNAVDLGIRNLWDSLKVRAAVLYRDVPGGVELLLEVNEMAVDLEPRFIGNKKIKTKRLREWAGIEERGELFLIEAPRVRQRLLENYRREGYYWAEIEVVSRGSATFTQGVAADVIFEIKEGPRVRVEEVNVLGNESLPNAGALWWGSGLKAYSKPKLKQPAWWRFRFRGSPFVEEELQADLLAMRQAYRDRGWFDAVIELEEFKFNRNRDKVSLTIRIDEGQPYLISSLELRAFAPTERGEVGGEVELYFPREELFQLLSLNPGVRFQKSLLDHDRLAVRSFYGERGYLDHPSLDDDVRWAFLEPEQVYDVENHTVALTYRILQGKQLKLRDVLVRGNTHTRDKVLRSRISVFPGDQANQNEIERSLRRIRSTGFFSDDLNAADHPEPSFKFVPVEGSPDVVDLEFLVAEGRVVDANLAGGIDSNDGLFGLITLSMRNFDITDLPSGFFPMFKEIYNKEAFHGAGQRLDLEVSPGTQLSRFRARYFVPDLLGTDLNPIGLDVEVSKRRRIYDDFDEDRFESRFRLVRRYENDLLVGFGLTYGSVKVSDVDNNVPELLMKQDEEGRQGLVGPLLEFSRRDVDDLRIPHKGYSWRLNSTLYSNMLGGDVEMLSSRGSYDWYKPAHENDEGLYQVLHFGIDGGVLVPYGDTDDAPYTERFQLGGRSSLRGLAFRQVGPYDGNDPIGGETFLSGTMEYYLPLSSIPRPDGQGRLESFRGSLFVDYGVLDPDPFKLDLDEVRVTAGFGVGLVFPLPIQLNFGFPIVADPDDERQVLTFAFSLN